MRDNRIALCMFAAASVIQLIAMNNIYGGSLPGLPFATAYETGASVTVLISRVFCIYIPVPFIMFSVNGTGMADGYSSLQLMRNGSRNRFFARKTGKSLLMVAFMVIFLAVMSTAAGAHGHDLTLGRIADILLIYWLVVIDLVFLEYAVELVIGLKQNAANISVNIYFVVSMLMTGIRKSRFTECIFFPGAAFVKANELYDGIYSRAYLMELIMLAGFIGMFAICIRKYGKADIF